MPRPAPDRGIRRPERLRLTWTLVLGVLLAGPQSARADGALLGGPLAVDRTDVATGPAPAPSPARRRIGSEALVSVPEAIDGGPRLPAGVASLPHQELELADVGEVYATGEPLIEWQDPQDLTDYGDLWDRIRNGFAMAEIDSPLVQRHEAWYLNRPEYVERMVARSRRYLFHIVEELEKRGMPMEIALLPMIESAYNPVAQSHMSAVGMWQFIPSTGKEYGLQQNWWYDARRDVLAATQAALDYLQYLHQRFGDWELALAAYNWGEGAVSRAITNNRKAKRPTDYMNLKMPKETRNYLPKLQAVKNIVSDPVVLGMALEPIPDRPYFAVVKVPAHIDVAMAAKLADVPLEEFRYLNPGHNRPVITVANRQLLLPVDKVDIFNANLQSNDQPLVTWQTYQLKDDDTLESVARKFDIDLSRLREVNGLGGNRGTRPGQMLLVPMEDDADTNLDETYDSPEFRAPLADHTQRMIYRVKRGDTLSSIARRYGVTIAKLKDWNGLRRDQVQIGQRLTIWERARASTGKSVKHSATATTGSKASSKREIYRVKRGDTLSSIARRHGVSIASLKAWNGLRNDRVQAGQRLNVQEPARASAGSSKAGAKRSSKQTHAGGKPQQRTANN